MQFVILYVPSNFHDGSDPQRAEGAAAAMSGLTPAAKKTALFDHLSARAALRHDGLSRRAGNVN
jgi:hypothetical protein